MLVLNANKLVNQGAIKGENLGFQKLFCVELQSEGLCTNCNSVSVGRKTLETVIPLPLVKVSAIQLTAENEIRY